MPNERPPASAAGGIPAPASIPDLLHDLRSKCGSLHLGAKMLGGPSPIKHKKTLLLLAERVEQVGRIIAELQRRAAEESAAE